MSGCQEVFTGGVKKVQILTIVFSGLCKRKKCVCVTKTTLYHTDGDEERRGSNDEGKDEKEEQWKRRKGCARIPRGVIPL